MNASVKNIWGLLICRNLLIVVLISQIINAKSLLFMIFTLQFLLDGVITES